MPEFDTLKDRSTDSRKIGRGESDTNKYDMLKVMTPAPHYRYMRSSETEYTSIPIRKEDHRNAKEVKRNGESWSLFIRRAVEELDPDK